MSFENKVILVTGGSSGIGADAARHLAKLGGKVALVGRNENRLNDVVEQIKCDGSPTPLRIIADLTKDGDPQRIIDETIKYFGKLDVLINNAGVIRNDSIVNFETSEFDRILNTNLRSAIILTNLAVPHLERSKGNILNISSVAGLRPTPNGMSYSISKAGLDQFTKCCALDLASKGIRVNSINAAVVRSPFAETIGLSKEAAAVFFDKAGETYPLGRVGETSDVSMAIAYLASDSASFITGILMPLDGGSMINGLSTVNMNGIKLQF